MRNIIKLSLSIALAGFCQLLLADKTEWDVTFKQGYGIEKYKKYEPLGAPKGAVIELQKQSDGALVGFIKLPFEADKGRMVKMTESQLGQGYNRLVMDVDGDGSVEDDEIMSTEVSPVRNSFWFNFSANLSLTYSVKGGDLTRDYPVLLWAVTDELGAAPTALRFASRGFLVGEVFIDGVEHYVMLSDSHNDAQYGEGDTWSVRSITEVEANTSSRLNGDFVWSGESAYVLTLSDSAASKGLLSAHKPGISKKDDLVKRDRYHFDRRAKRAEKPLHFSHDVQTSIKQAQDSGSMYFVDFETEWCGPCKQMDKMVYTAQAVVDAAKEIICIKADGDVEEELVEQYEIDGYPTGILFTPEGEEVARFVGYQGVAEMKGFLSQKNQSNR